MNINEFESNFGLATLDVFDDILSLKEVNKYALNVIEPLNTVSSLIQDIVKVNTIDFNSMEIFNTSILNNLSTINLGCEEYLSEALEVFAQAASDLAKIPTEEMMSSLSASIIDTQKYLLDFKDIINLNSVKNISLMTDISNMLISTFDYMKYIAEDIAITDEMDFDLEMDSKSYQNIFKSAIEIVKDTFNNLESINNNWIDNIKEKVEEYSEKHPRSAKLIKTIINKILIDKIFIDKIVVPLIISIFFVNQVGIDETYFSKVASGESTISEAKKESINNVENKELLKCYRYINTDNVSIRVTARMDSPAVINVNTGDTVRLIYRNGKKEKNKNWIHVIYTDQDENTYYGWINIAYTREIK